LPKVQATRQNFLRRKGPELITKHRVEVYTAQQTKDIFDAQNAAQKAAQAAAAANVTMYKYQYSNAPERTAAGME
jgi:hypothetical protein